LSAVHCGRTVIAVAPRAALAARARLFAALAEAFPVAFVPWQADDPPVDGVIVIADGESLPTAEQLATYRVPVFAVGGDPPAASRREAIQLLDVAGVDRRVRGIAVHDCVVATAGAADGAAVDVLAVAGSAAAWTRARSPIPVHRVRTGLPELGRDEPLYALLSKRPLTTVALLAFLRERTAPAGWRPPGLRAAIVFDDPNLRWRSYGFIDYRRLLAHAEQHGYHATMAMIPLDAGRPHADAAALFARRSDRLSLVFHGNDHIKGELMAPRDQATALAVVAQALRRVGRFERRSGLRVDRIMMPPHGLCARHVTAAVGALGFDALCAIHPLPWTAARPADPPLAGWHPAQFVDGCAVIPRIPLCSSAADIALTALLDHPLVLYGHHEDVAGGLEPLAEAAAIVNRLGDVQWTSVGEIATANHALSVVDGLALVRPFARRVRVDVSTGLRGISVEAPQDATDAEALVGWSFDAGEIHLFGDIAPAHDGIIEIRLHGRVDIEPDAVDLPAWRPWPRVRRAVTEARDRSLPLRPARAR
jgi:hypothetical protein